VVNFSEGDVQRNCLGAYADPHALLQVSKQAYSDTEANTQTHRQTDMFNQLYMYMISKVG